MEQIHSICQLKALLTAYTSSLNCTVTKNLPGSYLLTNRPHSWSLNIEDTWWTYSIICWNHQGNFNMAIIINLKPLSAEGYITSAILVSDF